MTTFRRALAVSAALSPAAVAGAPLTKVPLRKVPDDAHAAHLLASRGPAASRFAAELSSSAAVVAARRRRRLLRGDDVPAGTSEDVVLHDVRNAQVRSQACALAPVCRGAQSAPVP